MARTKDAARGKFPGGTATTKRGQALLSGPSIPQGGLTAQLADLRERFTTAILDERWAEAAGLQRAYREVERQRRRQLLQQAREVCYG